MIRLLCFLLGCAVSLPLPAASGFRQIVIKVPQTDGLQVALWYPTSKKGPLQRIGDNPAFKGSLVQRDAEPESGKHPLLLFSHGYGGSWRNLAWLATAMAEQGFIVAAPNHPGTTTNDLNPQSAGRLWLRPKALSRIMDRLIADARLAGQVDVQRIGAVGHSLGGWTVMALAGARFNSSQFIKDCQLHIDFSSCKLTARLGIDVPGTPLEGDLKDNRLKAIVVLDTGLARGFTAQSLASLSLPVMVLGAQIDLGGLPAQKESGYLAAHLPERWRHYEQVPDTTHFSFMQLCKPDGKKLIEAEAPGEGVVCLDGNGSDRKAIHQRLLTDISGFLSRSLAFPLRKPGSGQA